MPRPTEFGIFLQLLQVPRIELLSGAQQCVEPPFPLIMQRYEGKEFKD